MRRARNGFPLEDYLHGYRLGQQVVWDSIVEASDACGSDRRFVLGLASRLMRLIDFATTHAAQSYVEFRQHGLADAARSRRDLLEFLLDGHMPTNGGLSAAAERLGIGPGTCCLVAVALRLGEGPESDWSELASSGLARSPLSEPSVLVVARQDEIVAVIPLTNGRDAAAACAWLESSQERLRAEGVPLAIGVSTVARGVAELPSAYEEAQAAVRFVGTDGGTAALTRLDAFEYLTLNADPTSLRLIDPKVQAFLIADRRRGGVMIATIRAYAETDLSVKATAAALHVHPNTAQYRFQRIEELTGMNPRSFSGLHALLVAVELTDAHPSSN
jgi:sugar diacid utilization regulator